MDPAAAQLLAAFVTAEVAWKVGLVAGASAIAGSLGAILIGHWLAHRNDERERLRADQLESIRQTHASEIAWEGWLRWNYDKPPADRVNPPDLSQWPLASWKLLGDEQLLRDFFDLEFVMGSSTFTEQPVSATDLGRILSVAVRSEVALTKQRTRAIQDEPLVLISDERYAEMAIEQSRRFMRQIPKPAVPITPATSPSP